MLPDGEEVISLDTLNKWNQGEDGYWYFPKPVKSSEITDFVLESVSMNPKAGNLYQGSKIRIDVYAQGVQSANNGTDIKEAIGWPKETEVML